MSQGVRQPSCRAVAQAGQPAQPWPTFAGLCGCSAQINWNCHSGRILSRDAGVAHRCHLCPQPVTQLSGPQWAEVEAGRQSAGQMGSRSMQ